MERIHVIIYQNQHGAEVEGAYDSHQQVITALNNLFYDELKRLGRKRLNAYDQKTRLSFSLFDESRKQICAAEIVNVTLNRTCHPIAFIDRDDIANYGYDTDAVDDGTLEKIADRMGDNYLRDGFSSDLFSALDFFNIKKNEKNGN